MKISDVKFQATKAMNSYFTRNWTRKDMMNCGEILEGARTSLKTVYLTLFCATLAMAFGTQFEIADVLSFLCSDESAIWLIFTPPSIDAYHSLFCSTLAMAYGNHEQLIQEAEEVFTVLFLLASSYCLYYTPPGKVTKKVSIMMTASFSFGTSIGLIMRYYFKIDQGVVVVVGLLQGASFFFASFWFAVWICRRIYQIYITVSIETFILLCLWFDITQWISKMYILLAFFMVYLILYSQEILYDASRFEELDFVGYASTIIVCFPAIVVHAIRVCLGVNNQQHLNEL